MMKGRKNLLLLDKRMVKHVSGVSKTTNTSRVYLLIVLKQLQPKNWPAYHCAVGRRISCIT